MTVEEIVAAQARLLGFEPADITGDEDDLAEYIGYINDALTEVVNHGDWAWLYATADVTLEAGQERVDLPGDFAAFLDDAIPYYQDNSAYVFEYAERSTIHHLRSVAITTTGQPILYNHAYNATTNRWQLTLWPAADVEATLIVPYRRRPAALIAITETPPIPLDLHVALKYGACAITEEEVERMEVGSKRGKFERELAKCWLRYKSPIRDQHIRESKSWAGDEAFDPYGDGPLVVSVTAP